MWSLSFLILLIAVSSLHYGLPHWNHKPKINSFLPKLLLSVVFCHSSSKGSFTLDLSVFPSFLSIWVFAYPYDDWDDGSELKHRFHWFSMPPGCKVWNWLFVLPFACLSHTSPAIVLCASCTKTALKETQISTLSFQIRQVGDWVLSWLHDPSLISKFGEPI